MTSAYGGIRWESGRSRQFQYEQTQSRIGLSMSDSLQLYIDNSPVFFADKVKTPLLIMHNDKDGAVPWYQGIELFMTLRRLDKPVWMLQYNGEDHNLVNRRNSKEPLHPTAAVLRSLPQRRSRPGMDDQRGTCPREGQNMGV